MLLRVLDRYLLREWLRILAVTALGFPLIAILFELTDKLDVYLARGLGPATIGVAYVFSLPDKIFLVLPAAVLFATLFSIGNMNRHSELTAAKASGVSFYRITVPVLFAALLAAGLDLAIGEMAPPATRRQSELLGDVEARARDAQRFNFVYRAEEGWTYTIRELRVQPGLINDLVLEREGTGVGYPTLAIQAQRALYRDSTWILRRGVLRVLQGHDNELTFAFDSLRMPAFHESPDELTAEAKKPQEMGYAELGRYIDALERSGGNGRLLRVERALKIAIPFTCLIIALFAAPLVTTAPRAGGAMGVALGLGTTILFLLLVQLSRAIGAGGVVSPVLAAWLPNLAFAAVGLVLLRKAPT